MKLYDEIAAFFSEIAELTEQQPEAAFEKLEKFLKNWKLVKARACNDAGVAAFRQGDPDKALKYYHQAVELAPEEIIFRKNLADLLYFEFGDSDAALAHFRWILQQKPDDFEANLAIGRICADLGRHFLQEADDFFSLSQNIEPGNPLPREERQRLGQMRETNSRKESTQTEISPSTPKANSNPEEEYAALSRSFEPENPAATEEKIKKFLFRYPDFALAHNDLGVISFQLGKPNEAARLYREAVKLAPDNITFRKNLADFVYVIEQDPETAMSHYHKILQSAPQDTETLMMIGKICLEQGMLDDARSFFRLVLQNEPWHLEAGKALEVLDKKKEEKRESGDCET